MAANCYCGAPAPNAWLCPVHDLELEQRLSELSSLTDDLQAHIGRLLRFSTGRIGSRSTEIPLPIRIDNRYYVSRASSLADELRNALVGIVRHLIESRGLSAHTLPPDELTRIAAWVGARSASVRSDETASEVLHDLRRLSQEIHRVVDRPSDWVYAGICSIDHAGRECSQELYAERGATFMTCRGCGYTHDVKRRQSVLQAAARDILLTIPELKAALPEVLGVKVSHDLLRKWKQRGRIVAHGVTTDGRETFKVGDVLDVAFQQHSERAS